MTPPGAHRFFATAGIARTIEARFTGLDANEQRAVIARLKADRSPVAGLPKLGRRLLHGGSSRPRQRGLDGSAGGASGEHADVSRHVGQPVPGTSAASPTAREAHKAQCGGLAALNAVASAGVGLQRTRSALRRDGSLPAEYPITVLSQAASTGASRTCPYLRRPHGDRRVSRLRDLLRGDRGVHRGCGQEPRGAQSAESNAPGLPELDGASNPRAVWVRYRRIDRSRPTGSLLLCGFERSHHQHRIGSGIASIGYGTSRQFTARNRRSIRKLHHRRARSRVRQGGGCAGGAERAACGHPGEVDMNQSEAHQLWAMLGEEGKAPTELTQASQVLPSYSVGIEPWIRAPRQAVPRGLVPPCRALQAGPGAIRRRQDALPAHPRHSRPRSGELCGRLRSLR